MSAAVLYGSNDLRLEKVLIPVATAGSMVIKVDACAICGSDLRILRHGNSRIDGPRVIGHEVSGTVAFVGDGVTRFKVGDKVSVGADIPCGQCKHCISGHGNNCDINLAIGYQFDGGFAEYLKLEPVMLEHGPVKKIHGEYTVSQEAALSEPLACCLNGFEVAYMQEGATVAVFGAGPIGIMLINLAKKLYSSSLVIAIEPNLHRRNIAEGYGADITLDPNDGDLVDKILGITGGVGVERVFTACSIQKTHEQALRIVAKRGFVNFFGGLPKVDPILLDSNWIHYRESYITGSHGCTPKHHAQALDLIERKIIDAKSFITHTFPLNQIGQAFEMAASGDAVKVIIKPWDI